MGRRERDELENIRRWLMNECYQQLISLICALQTFRLRIKGFLGKVTMDWSFIWMIRRYSSLFIIRHLGCIVTFHVIKPNLRERKRNMRNVESGLQPVVSSSSFSSWTKLFYFIPITKETILPRWSSIEENLCFLFVSISCHSSLPSFVVCCLLTLFIIIVSFSSSSSHHPQYK